MVKEGIAYLDCARIGATGHQEEKGGQLAEAEGVDDDGLEGGGGPVGDHHEEGGAEGEPELRDWC
jgi:hypothetical protein